MVGLQYTTLLATTIKNLISKYPFQILALTPPFGSRSRRNQSNVENICLNNLIAVPTIKSTIKNMYQGMHCVLCIDLNENTCLVVLSVVCTRTLVRNARAPTRAWCVLSLLMWSSTVRVWDIKSCVTIGHLASNLGVGKMSRDFKACYSSGVMRPYPSWR